MAAQGHDIAKKVLDWRGLAKLRGTYTDALPGYINPKTGRVHTSYAMASTSTGRLASTDPNLQNIPVRTEEGRRIRQAFIAAKGNKLISADYSQIELRLLAHIADIPQLKKAFADNLDIHAMTASEIFGVPVKDMPAEMRRRAKAINFGIVYGISGFGLANQLGIAQSEASDYIKKYFARFPGIRDYMEDTKQFARTHGFVETLFGRRIHIREINSKIPGFRGGAERAAINAPIQGAAADIIRRAMVRLPGALADKKLTASMLLQVHDELIFEAPDKEVEATCKLVDIGDGKGRAAGGRNFRAAGGRGARRRQLGRRALTRIRAIAAASAGLALLVSLVVEFLLMTVKGNAILIPGLLDYAQVWNRGVSFSLLWQSSDTGQYVLIAGLAVVAVGVGILAWRAANGLAAIGYGLIVGGALGNLVDRSLHLSVFDYLFLHLGRMPLFVCNFPDIAISAGVVLLIAEGLLKREAIGYS